MFINTTTLMRNILFLWNAFSYGFDVIPANKC